MAGKGKRKSILLLWIGLICLFIAIITMAITAADINRQYRAESALTSVPFVSPRTVAITAIPGQPVPESTEVLLMMDSIGRDVKELQQRLVELGYYSGEIDGIFGEGTLASVKAFQEQNDLNIDGIVGKITKMRLFSNSAQKFAATPIPTAHSENTGSLPLLVNREHTLPADFYPKGLVELAHHVTNGLMIMKYPDIQGVAEAVDALEDMIQMAIEDGLSPWQISAGFRTYASQSELFERKKQSFIKQGFSERNAESAARQTVADPGTSEHQTGLAFDITVPGYNFEDTPQSDWLAQHCWEYGFIIRYTDEKKSITGFLGEPWHIRYVGLPYSLEMDEKKLCLEEYLAQMGLGLP